MSFGLTMAGVAAALGPMVMPALTGAALGAGTGLITGGTSSDDWWKGALMGGLGGAAGQMGGLWGGTSGGIPGTASTLPAKSIWGFPGKDAAGIASLTNASGPVQTAGLFSGGFQPGAYTMGAGDTVSKFTPPPGLLSNDNLMKAYMGSSILKRPQQQQQSKLPSQLSRSQPSALPYRQPIMGGFMGKRPPRIRFSR